MSPSPTGYASAEYARSLVHVGAPLELGTSGGWLLRRPIDGADSHDACGPYPLLSLPRPDALADDLAALEPGLVSVTAVVDPTSGATEDDLRRAFPDHLVAFKEHFVVELDGPPLERATAHHRRDARRGLRKVEVDAADPRGEHWEDWIALYAHLVERHGITGPAAFPRESFDRLRDVPGLHCYRASIDGATVGMQLWLVGARTASYHLAATNGPGYSSGAAYALMAHALDDLRARGIELAHLGAGAGAEASADDGLTKFKRGWATGTRTAWLGGRVLDRPAYETLVARRDDLDPGSGWFPLYRHP